MQSDDTELSEAHALTEGLAVLEPLSLQVSVRGGVSDVDAVDEIRADAELEMLRRGETLTLPLALLQALTEVLAARLLVCGPVALTHMLMEEEAVADMHRDARVERLPERVTDADGECSVDILPDLDAEVELLVEREKEVEVDAVPLALHGAVGGALAHALPLRADLEGRGEEDADGDVGCDADVV